MSGPNLSFLYSGKDTTPPAPNVPNLGFLYADKTDPKPKGPEQQGFFDYLANLAGNWWKVTNVQDALELQKMGIQSAGSQIQDPESQHIAQLMQHTTPSGNIEDSPLFGAMHDFANFFGKIGTNTKEALTKLKETPGGLVTALKNDPTGTVGQLAKAFTQPISDYAELSSGFNLTGDDIKLLTPEEKVARVKGLAATAVMMAVGAGTSKALAASSQMTKELIRTEEVVGGIATVGDLAKASSLTAKGALAKNLMKSTVVAGASGAAYGLVRYANESDQLAETLVNGIVFAPLGPAFELLHLGKGTKDQLAVATKASELLTLRQIQDLNNSSLFDITNQVKSLSTSKDLVRALMDAKVTLSNKDLLHVDGLDMGDVSKLQSNLPPDHTYWLHDTSNMLTGDEPSVRALVMRNDMEEALTVYNPDSKSLFERHGVIPNQIVSIDGNDYVVTGVADKAGSILNLEEIGTGLPIRALPQQIRPKTQVELGDPRGVINTPISLKGRVIQQIRNWMGNLSGPSWASNVDEIPIVQQTSQAIRNAETGKPFSAPLFRMERGSAAIPGTGRFYSSTLEDAASYSPNSINKKTGQQGNSGAPIMSDAKVLLKFADKLKVHKVEFTNPLVMEGRQGGILMNQHFLDMLTPDEQTLLEKTIKTFREDIHKPKPSTLPGLKPGEGPTYLEYPKGVGSETGYSRIDRMMADLARKYGFDGIIYGPHEFEGGYGHTPAEVVDLGPHPILPKKSSPLITITPTALSQDSFMTSLWNDFKKNLFYGDPQKEMDMLYKERDQIADKQNVILERKMELRKAGKSGVAEYSSFHPYMETDEWKALSKQQDDLIARSDEIDKQLPELLRKARAIDPMGFDETPPSAMDHAPDVSFDRLFSDWTSQHGFQPDELPQIRREFDKRLVQAAINSMDKGVDSPEFKSLIRLQEAFKKQIEEENKLNTIKKEITTTRVARIARSNGMYIDTEDAGHLSIRDLESGILLKKVDNAQDAISFINQSGQANGVALDSGASVPPNGTGGFPSGVDFPDDNFVYQGQGRTGSLIDTMNVMAPAITPYRAYVISLDNKYNTQFFSKVFDALQSARRVSNAKIRPYYEKLKGIEKIVEKLGPADREMISNYMETMSPQEIIDGFMARKMTDVEQKLGKRVADSGVDVSKVFEYRRQREKLQKDFGDNFADNPDYNKQEIDLQNQLGMDENHLGVSSLFDAVTSMNKRDASLGAIVRLARAYTNNEVSKPEFAAKNKMSMEQLNAANKLAGLYRELAGAFGIDPKTQLNGYMTHARLYNDGIMSRAFDQFSGDVAAKEFYAKMARTGEITAYEKDPIRAMQRYIKAGFDAQNFSEALANARAAGAAELDKLPLGARDGARKVLDRYVSDIQGWPGAGEKATQAAVDELAARFGLDADIDVRRGIVNAISATIPAATQGARIAAGIRDLGTGIMLSFGRFGFSRTNRMLKLGAKALTGPIREELERLGDITIASPLSFADATEQAQGTLRAGTGALIRGADRASKTLFKLSGQQDVYALMHAGTYLSTREAAMAQLLKLSRGEIVWNDVKKALKLDTYDAPVIQKFVDQVKLGQNDEAARFLAIQTGYDMIGVFGLANHPYLWGTNIGRIAGQFGNWPMWLRTNIVRMATRGSWADRVTSIARLTAANAAVIAVGAKVGLNLGNWSIAKGLAYAGGPLVDLYETVNDAVGSSGYRQREGVRRLLKFLPYDPTSGEFNIKQVYIPGSFFVNDLVDAASRLKQGHPLQALERVSGFRTLDQTGGP